jgi:hypothetical protein
MLQVFPGTRNIPGRASLFHFIFRFIRGAAIFHVLQGIVMTFINFIGGAVYMFLQTILKVPWEAT